jgi:hypothetical protein
MKTIAIICFSWILCFECKSQECFRKNFLMISNVQLVINNYVPLKIDGLAFNNYFNTENLYSYLLLIGDEQGRNHQLIYQTNFTGALEFIGLSTNLYNRFKCKENPFWKFNACINQIDKTNLNTIYIDAVVDCILMRINDCE